MKIIHIITDLQSGGAERMLSKIVSNDNRNKHVIILLLKGKIHYNIPSEIKIYNLGHENNLLSKIKIFRELATIIKTEKPEIIQTWLKVNYYAPILKMLNRKIKFVINIRNGVQKNKSKLVFRFLSWYLNRTDGQIFVSNSSKNEHEKSGFNFKKSIVINNGFDSVKYLYRQNISHSNEKLQFGHVGRFHPIKNQKLLIKAFNEFAKNKDVSLHLAGRNLKYEKFEELIDKVNNDKFIWYGEIENTFEFYKGIDALILTSKSEGFPNVIGEAMSIGVPIITTNAGESYEIIGNSGYKIKNDISSVVEVLEHINNNKFELQDKSNEAYKIIKNNYSLSFIINSYINYYKKILEDK